MGDRRAKTYFSADCHDAVDIVQFCPYEWSSYLLGIATTNRLTIASCKFPDENPELDDVDYNVLKDFHHDTRITAISWSPATSLISIPKVLRFFTSGADHKIYHYSSDLEANSNRTVIGEHRDYINDISVQPEKGDHIASVSDDHTCKVWGTDGGEVACFPLSTAGMAVKWHIERPEKLMVAEKKGLIRFYNIQTQQPVMSLDCGHVPLMSADWCPSNVLLVSCIAGSDWFVFDTSRSSCSLENKAVHLDGGQQVQWSRTQRHLLATKGQPGSQIKVVNVHSNQVLLTKDHVISSGLSWHYRLPLLAVGGDNKVHFYKIEVM